MSRLSSAERIQLADISAPSGTEWRSFRNFIAERDRDRRPSTIPELMAYTPGETVDLFLEQKIYEWHQSMSVFKIPEHIDLVCFVPCAATKPWEGAVRGIYKSYNQLRRERDCGELPSFYLVTISEPLGVVPEAHWKDFPQYENPGLFRSNFLRFGMTNDELEKFFGRRVRLPFGEGEFSTAIQTLASVIKRFVRSNLKEGRTFISFVEGRSQDRTDTHSQMLDVAVSSLPFIRAEHRYLKRGSPRQAPYGYLKEIILQIQKGI